MNTKRNSNNWTTNYNVGIQDTGITTPSSYNLFSNPEPPYILTAASLQGENVAPVNYNPSSMVYTQGNLNHVLLGSGTNTCDSGCVKAPNKSDPRVFQVKPLYKPHIFKEAPGSTLPTSYNVTGMY